MSEILLIIFLGIFFFIIGIYFNNIILLIRGKRDRVKKKKEEINYSKREYNFNSSDDLKMVFLVRQDLKMKAGKIAAQVAHAAIGLYDDILEGENIYQKSALNNWFNYGQKKVVLKIPDLDKMLEVVKNCKKLKLQYCIISDAGHTQIPQGSITVLGIGPDIGDKINSITGTFKLMN